MDNDYNLGNNRSETKKTYVVLYILHIMLKIGKGSYSTKLF